MRSMLYVYHECLVILVANCILLSIACLKYPKIYAKNVFELQSRAKINLRLKFYGQAQIYSLFS